MKLRTLLNEIGDSTKVFPYNKSSIVDLKKQNLPRRKDCQIKFKTDKKTNYVCDLSFTYILEDSRYSMEAAFRIEWQDFDHQSNKFEMFPVMSTIVDIIVYAIKLNEGLISFLEFNPTKTDDDEYRDNSASETQRGKFYISFLKKAFDRNQIEYEVYGDNDTVQFKIL